MDSTTILVCVALAAWSLLALIPASIAHGRGYAFGRWYVHGLLTGVIAIVQAAGLTPVATRWERARVDPTTGRWITYDNDGKWYWWDGAEWQPVLHWPRAGHRGP